MSRKITKQAVEAFLCKRPFRSGNTAVTTGVSGSTMLELRGNVIARCSKTGGLEITLAGWNTPTTRERLNSLPGVRVHQFKGVPYLNGAEWDGGWTEIAPGHVRCFDDGGVTADRYTAVYLDFGRAGRQDCLGMSENCDQPNGVCQHTECDFDSFGKNAHLGKPILFGDLPPACRAAVRRDLNSKD